jgi:hypothetical protein
MATELTGLQTAISEAELEKLQLEVQQLKNKSKWSDRFAPYISLLTVTITIGGFLFGVIQFNAQQELQRLDAEKVRLNQERDTDAKLQDRFKSDVEKLLKFTRDQQLTPSQVNLTLNDLRECIKLRTTSPASENTCPEKEFQMTREVSDALIEAFLYDCDLTEKRHEDFLDVIFANWPDLELYINENSDSGNLLLEMHAVALAKLYKNNPKTIGGVSYDVDEDNFDFMDDKLDESDKDFFIALAGNYADIYKAMNSARIKGGKETFAKDFEIATCNTVLTKQLLGIDFDMKNDTDFKECAKPRGNINR